MIRSSTSILPDSTKRAKSQFKFVVRQLIKRLTRAARSKQFSDKEKSNPMFNNISWSDYLTFITVSSLIWYAFVLYSYYRHDLLNTARRKQPVSDHTMNFTYVPLKEQVPSANHEDYQPKATETDTPHIVKSFADEVEAYFEETGKDGISKDVLLQHLTIIAGKYLSLGQSEYRDSLDQLIINQAEVNCAVFLNENEVGGIWS